MGAMDDKVVLPVVLDQAILDELAHQVCCHLACCVILSELSKFLLELENLHLLILSIHLLLSSCFFVSFDLSLSSASLG